MLRIVHFASYLAALVVPDGIKLFWMTDDDPIVPNPKQAARAMDVFHSLLPEYTGKSFPLVGWAMPFPECGCMLHHDLLSAADLAAGAFSEYCSSVHGRGELTERAQQVYGWLARQGSGLRKTTVVLERANDRELQISGLQGSLDSVTDST